jgi:EAL domain-containing protein (putative c-di-GMP-specific phosphodiesterase class I)
VRSVCALAQDLGLEVVGEGVENCAMAQDLLQAGGVYGQGYGYAPPLGALEAEVFLNECYLDGGPLKPRG